MENRWFVPLLSALAFHWACANDDSPQYLAGRALPFLPQVAAGKEKQLLAVVKSATLRRLKENIQRMNEMFIEVHQNRGMDPHVIDALLPFGQYIPDDLAEFYCSSFMALGSKALTKMVKLYLSDPNGFWIGWPDIVAFRTPRRALLRSSRPRDLVLVEVKSTDNLLLQQMVTIFSMRTHAGVDIRICKVVYT